LHAPPFRLVRRRLWAGLCSAALLAATPWAHAQTGWQSALVQVGPTSTLVYAADAEGNRIPDFSHAGYQSGEAALPDVAARVALTPSGADDTPLIQSALDAVAALPADANGHRGAVELAAGSYRIDGTLRLEVSGVVLRGAGSSESEGATVLRRSGDNEDAVVYLGRERRAQGDALVRTTGAPVRVVSPLVPVGDRQLEVADASRFRAGDDVVVRHPSAQAWLDAVGGGGTASDDPWAPGDVDVALARTIERIDGNRLTLDAPTFYRLDTALSPVEVYHRDATDVVREVGVEGLRVVVETDSATAEHQARDAVVFGLTEHAWARDVTALHFWRSGFSVQNSRYVTVRDCAALDPHSRDRGGRRYNFEVSKGQLVLFKNNRATGARHAFVGNGGPLDSGVVFTGNTSANASTSSEAHRRWGTGFLFDRHVEIGAPAPRSTFDRRIHLGNRGDYGTSHGWSCANCVVWNAEMSGGLVVVEKPPTAQNYAIGVSGLVSTTGPFLSNTQAHVEGTDRPGLVPASLYARQLADRTQTGTATDPGADFGTTGAARVLPNPVRDSAQLALGLERGGQVTLAVYDLIGRRVARVPPQPLAAGAHRLALPTGGLAPGLYLVRVTAGGRVLATARLVRAGG
jgi:hypothetical protein